MYRHPLGTVPVTSLPTLLSGPLVTLHISAMCLACCHEACPPFPHCSFAITPQPPCLPDIIPCNVRCTMYVLPVPTYTTYLPSTVA
ncbi:hypothetical protein LX32DRAFT_200084 [Colletotrichum zoysiae]|uniref:Uncharacterized protein n=1 Tax=Colletotrichum zoysiae TaxID=1216348 RepID=A0AAD9HNV0_9PEZI|nr:hypothetical protein LX32DRAFT_200084 [Colletotrichum zoysiae]